MLVFSLGVLIKQMEETHWTIAKAHPLSSWEDHCSGTQKLGGSQPSLHLFLAFECFVVVSAFSPLQVGHF